MPAWVPWLRKVLPERLQPGEVLGWGHVLDAQVQHTRAREAKQQARRRVGISAAPLIVEHQGRHQAAAKQGTEAGAVGAARECRPTVVHRRSAWIPYCPSDDDFMLPPCCSEVLRAARCRWPIRASDRTAHRPGGWRTTKPANSPPPCAQRVPVSACATVSNRRPATCIHTWPALA